MKRAIPIIWLLLPLLFLHSACARSMKPPQELVAWLNREVPAETIDGVRFEYHLEYVSEQKDFIETKFTMVSRDTTRAGLVLTGDGIVAFERRANRLLATDDLRLWVAFVSGSPVVDRQAGTVTWEQSFAITPVRQR